MRRKYPPVGDGEWVQPIRKGGHYLTREARIVGGLEAKDLETLADAMVRDANEADADTRPNRNVNSQELETLCVLVIARLRRSVQPNGQPAGSYIKETR